MAAGQYLGNCTTDAFKDTYSIVRRRNDWLSLFHFCLLAPPLP